MTQVELHRNSDGTYQMHWQLPGDKVHSTTASSASDAARILLGLGNFNFVRGLKLPLE